MIEYLPLKRITAMHAAEIREALREVVDSGWYLKGEATTRFEQHYAQYIGTRHCIAVANGLDALTIMLRAYIELGKLHEGDEVIVPANTYIATILAITENRLVPVLVEPRVDTFQIDDLLIEQSVTSRIRAVMIVHLYGRCAFTERIADICCRHDLLLLEDNAQAHGCTFAGAALSPQSSLSSEVFTRRKTGSLGHAAAHSFYPGKNLGALGDAGAVTTNDEQLASVVRSLANYGSSCKYVFDYVGRNSRIDELQAAVLDVKLKYLDADNSRRREIASAYISNLHHPLIILPCDVDGVFHIFPVLCTQRDKLQQHLSEANIKTVIHYPIPPHKQNCYSNWHDLCFPITERIHEQELSLPCHQAMTEEEVASVINAVNAFSV